MSLHPDEALALILNDIPPPQQEILPTTAALGRFLAAELRATVDQPPFDKSAMDGYAHGEEGKNADGSWNLVEVIAAGAESAKALHDGECSRIMTGAPIPTGTVAVQRREYAQELDGRVSFTQKETSLNIIRRGENQKAGDLLITPRLLEAQDIGVLASSGYAVLPVARRAMVGIVSTGDELAECGSPLPPGAVYDSNGPQLAAQAAALGCDTRFYGIVRDNQKSLAEVIGKSLDECDVTIVSGAVSLGDFDYVPAVFAVLGVREIFHGLKMRPGKPTFYGRLGPKAVFGLPGNPVSTFVNFEILVKPHLLKRMGAAEMPKSFLIPLAAPLSRRGSDRVEYLPAMIVSDEPKESGKAISRVKPLSYRGSSMISILAEADCLVRMDIGAESIPEGEAVYVRLIRS